MSKLAQGAFTVHYLGPDQGPFRCGRCEYFRRPTACVKVKGPIAAQGCCNLFEPRAPRATTATHGALKVMQR